MITLENVSKYYHTGSSVGLGVRDVNLTFKKGEFVAITGESGSGKSTLLNIISGLDKYEDGEMYLFGQETSHYLISDWEHYRAKNIGFVFQSYNIVDSYTVLENILLALELQGYDEATRKERALELIDKVGLSHRVHHKAGKLSGGEKQRTVIARALAKDARVIVCDEPTGNLDSKSSKQVLDLIHEISKDRLVVLVTHNFEEVKDMATRRIRLRDGEVIEDRQLTEKKEVEDFKDDIQTQPVGFDVLTRLSFRNLFATPRRLLFVLSLQTIVIGIFIFIYAYLMFSQEILVGEIANESDSSHQLEVVRRDEEIITDYSSLMNIEGVKSVVEYETTYSAYSAIGYKVIDPAVGTFALEEINMDDATVLNIQDITDGALPQTGEIVVNETLLEMYGLHVGDEVTLLKAYTKYTRSIGDNYIISGTTLRGNSQSIYFNGEVFEDVDLALDGLIIQVGKNMRYDYYRVEDRQVNTDTEYNASLYSGKFVFTDEVEEGKIMISSALLGDLMDKQILSYELTVGPYYGKLYTFDLSLDDVILTGMEGSNFYLSTSFQEELTAFFFDDYEVNKVILNVHDITDGKEVAAEIDQTEYRVFYQVASLSTRSELMTSAQFQILSYVIVVVIGSLLYMIMGVVLRNVNHSRNKDFAIFRSMGANKSFLAKMVIFEQVVTGVMAYFIVIVILIISGHYSYMVEQALAHVFLYQYIVLFILSILLSVQIARRFNKRIFKLSVISSLNDEKEGLL